MAFLSTYSKILINNNLLQAEKKQLKQNSNQAEGNVLFYHHYK